MNFTQKDYETIIAIEDTDYAFDEFMTFFHKFSKDYETMESLDMNDSKKMTELKTSIELIFKGLKYCITINKDDVDSLNSVELEKYNDLNSNIDIIISNIFKTELSDKDSILYSAINKVLEYFEMFSKDMESLNDMMEKTDTKMTNSIDQVNDTLVILSILKELNDEVSIDYYKDKLVWCNDKLSKFHEDEINIVTENITLKNNNYEELCNKAKESNDMELQKKYSIHMFIENLLSLKTTLEYKFDMMMLKNLSSSVKDNTINEDTITEDIKWCKNKLVKYDKNDVIKVLKDFRNPDGEDYKQIIMNSLENNDEHTKVLYTTYAEIFNILSIIMVLDMKKSIESN
ncbi:MAG: hypothetical protein H8E55_10810 [Pelagibacterales bacterium]|nr:hypothetical protein [Pelagibacterales bacterium]